MTLVIATAWEYAGFEEQSGDDNRWPSAADYGCVNCEAGDAGRLFLQRISMSYSLPMRNRPLWHVIGAVIVFAVVQQYFEEPNSFLSVDRLLTAQYWLKGIIVLLIIVYLLEKIGRRGGDIVRLLVVDDDSGSGRTTRAWPSILGGLVIVSSVLVVLECRQPFFFTQDDNLMQFLPVILQGCRSLLHGVFPTWNPYQFLGAPTTTVGVYALTYPVTYVSYLASRYLLGNEFFTLEIYCMFHIVSGYLALYWAARSQRVRPALAATAALCAVLSGWSLIATRSWFYVGPIFVYMPLMLVGVAKLTTGARGWKWIVGMAVVIALFFHAGNVQFWAYGLLFFWLAVIILWCCQGLGRTEILSAGAATLLGVSMSLPLLLPQFLETRDTFRTMVPDVGILVQQWQAFFVPGPWIHAYNPANSVDPEWHTGGLIVYSGTTFVVLASLLVPCFLFYRIPRREIGRNVWFICALVAFMATIGGAGVIWPVMLRLPLLAKFRIPMKFLAFFNIFVVIVGAMMVERLLRWTRWPKALESCTVMGTLFLLAVAGTMNLPSWYSYGIKPYPTTKPLIEEVAGKAVLQHRVMTITFERSPSPRYWEELPLNMGTVYGVPAMHGYDPLVRYARPYRNAWKFLEEQPITALQEYGVKYVLQPADYHHPVVSYGGSHFAESHTLIPTRVRALVLEDTNSIFTDDEINIREVPGARPLAFAANDPGVSLPIELRADGFDLDASSLAAATPVVANFLWYPEIRAEAEGRRVAIRPDGYGRITLDLPAPVQHVRIRFVPAWGKGLVAGLSMAIAGMILGRFALGRQVTVKHLAASAS